MNDQSTTSRCALAACSAIEGLRYAKHIVANRRMLNRPAAYLAALDDVDIFLDAAIERLEHGARMEPVAVVQSASPNKAISQSATHEPS